MPRSFDEVHVTFADGEEGNYPQAWLLEEGWLRLEVRTDGGGTVHDYYSPAQIESFYET